MSGGYWRRGATRVCERRRDRRQPRPSGSVLGVGIRRWLERPSDAGGVAAAAYGFEKHAAHLRPATAAFGRPRLPELPHVLDRFVNGKPYLRGQLVETQLRMGVHELVERPPRMVAEGF